MMIGDVSRARSFMLRRALKRFRAAAALAPLAGAFLAAPAGAQVPATNFVNFEGKQTHPIRLSPDGSRLFAVNTPDNRLSVFDVSSPLNPILIAEIPVGLEPVSVNPRNNDEAWVVCEVSDAVSVVSVARQVVTDTISVQDEPADVVFANGRAFVSASRKNQIAVFDAATRAWVTNLAVFGENPRALAVNTNGTRVYAAFALSGNRTTLIPPDEAPPQPTNGMRAGLPPPPQVGLIVDATDPAWTTGSNPVIQYTMPDNDVVEIDTATLAVTRYFSRVGTVNLGLAVQPGSGDLFVANTDARNLTQFEPVLKGFFVTNQVSRINLASGAVTKFDLNPGFNPTNFTLADRTNALAQPTAIAFGPGGSNFWITAFGSDRVALMNAATCTVVTNIDLCPTAPGSVADPRNKRGPRGLALKPGAALYVLNRLANTITVVSASNRNIVREIPIGSFDPTPTVIRQGRGFLYDAKVSGNGTASCASCHIDAEMDLIAWDLGDPQGQLQTNRVQLAPGLPTVTSVFHPMKGPMTTQTLRGLRGLDPLHWRGDRTNFFHFIGAFEGLLGGPPLPGADMQAYSNFINTVVFQPNPNQNLDRTLPTSFAGGNPRAGFTNFTITTYTAGLNCNICHALPTGTAKAIIPAAALQESQDFKIPHLRNVYQKTSFTRTPGAQSVGGFGFVHDGVDPDLITFLSRPVFDVFARATNGPIRTNVNAFLMCLDTGIAPAVGYARTLTAANVGAASVSNDWSLLERQAGVVTNLFLNTNAVIATNLELVVKGTIDGQRRGLLYRPASNDYRSDKTGVGPFTRAQLQAKVLAGDSLTIMGVAPGTGVRIGIDRDLDGVLDGDEPRPTLQIARQGASGAVVSWSTNASDYVLEAAGTVASPSWATETSVRGLVSGNFTVTNAPVTTNRFFRLRGL
jgi:DNA-binding beta-propeller fold protein YncE